MKITVKRIVLIVLPALLAVGIMVKTFGTKAAAHSQVPQPVVSAEKQSVKTSLDTVSTASDTVSPSREASIPDADINNYIHYGLQNEAGFDSVLNTIDTARIRTSQLTLLCKTLPGIRDALGYEELQKRYGDSGTVPAELITAQDSLVHRTFSKAQKILDSYVRQVQKGITIHSKQPYYQIPDSISKKMISKLPDPAGGSFLRRGEFFFMGGGPFFMNPSDRMLEEQMNELPKNPGGFSFCSAEQVQTYRISDYLTSLKSMPFTVQFGGPLDQYDTPPISLNGIGSLILIPKKKVRGFFITEKGLFPAEIGHVREKLFDQGLNGNLEEPLVTFFTKGKPKSEILGFFYAPELNIDSCRVIRKGSIWSADLNNDSIADLACVTRQEPGYVSLDVVIECCWFVNSSGRWKCIDYACQTEWT